MRRFGTWLFVVGVFWTFYKLSVSIGNCNILALLLSICITCKKLFVNDIFDTFPLMTTVVMLAKYNVLIV